MATVATADPPAPAPTPVDLPTLSPSAPLNPYAKAALDIITGIVHARIVNDDNSANGQVTYFKRFEMQVRTSSNRYRTIYLHQGTVINPMGESLRAGQRVSARGTSQSDGSLAANAIDIEQ